MDRETWEGTDSLREEFSDIGQSVKVKYTKARSYKTFIKLSGAYLGP